ncbi:hypothetical protein [Alistipes timonensis]|uniref:hypothetical protein n=1 Tax=Alistipes timonensis TaxID=1465754 RepID=UPI00189AB718|nr:hypothetical protein [Alistipes timonensis]
MSDNSYTKEPANRYNSEFKQAKLDKEHEQTLQKEDHDHAFRCLQEEHKQKIDILKKNLGIIGCLFGSPENASKNITAIICIILLLGAAIISFVVYWGKDDISFVENIWSSIIPVITLALGYLFGKN